MNIRRFDIVEVMLPEGTGSEQAKKRPCIVVQNDVGNKFSPTTIVMPLTHVIKNTYLPTHTLIAKEDATGLRVASMLEGEQNRVIDKSRITRKLGRITSVDTKIEVVKVCFANLVGKKYIPDDIRQEIIKEHEKAGKVHERVISFC